MELRGFETDGSDEGIEIVDDALIEARPWCLRRCRDWHWLFDDVGVTRFSFRLGVFTSDLKLPGGL
jgi:hypothetical protein